MLLECSKEGRGVDLAIVVRMRCAGRSVVRSTVDGDVLELLLGKDMVSDVDQRGVVVQVLVSIDMSACLYLWSGSVRRRASDVFMQRSMKREL